MQLIISLSQGLIKITGFEGRKISPPLADGMILRDTHCFVEENHFVPSVQNSSLSLFEDLVGGL
jgi:hypothetical protein